MLSASGSTRAGLAVEHHLAQDGADRLALGEPLAPQPRQVLGGLDLVEGDPARGPAVGEAQVVERIEQAGHRGVREAQHGQDAQMLVAELGLDAAQERRVAQHGVDVRRDIRHGDRLALAGDGAVQEGQCLGIAEGLGLGQDGGQQLQGAVGLGDEPFELGVRLDLDGRLVGRARTGSARPGPRARAAADTGTSDGSGSRGARRRR